MSQQFRFLTKSKNPFSDTRFLFVLFSLIVFLAFSVSMHIFLKQIDEKGDPKCFTPLDKWPVRGPDCEGHE